MKIKIKKFDVAMRLGSNGIELEVKGTDEEHKGDLRLGKATIEWYPGRARKGIQKSWDDLIAFFEKDV